MFAQIWATPPIKTKKEKKVTSSWPTVFRPQLHFQVETEAGTCPEKTGLNQRDTGAPDYEMSNSVDGHWLTAVEGDQEIERYSGVSLTKTVYSQNRGTVLAYVLRLYQPYSQLPAWLDTDKVHKNTQRTFLSAALT